jgi:heme oxygenase (mycobilin-producing)
MSYIVTFEVQLQPGGLAEAMRILIDSLNATVAFGGFQSHELLVDNADPTRVVVLQRWASQSDHDQYLAWRATPQGGSDLSTVLVAPRVIRTFAEHHV